MQQRLALLSAALEVAFAAVLFHLGEVAGDMSPAFDLALVVAAAAGLRDPFGDSATGSWWRQWTTVLFEDF